MIATKAGKPKQSRVRIRQARPNDLEAYIDLQLSSWGSDMAVVQEKARIRFERCLDGILMAEVDGEVVGTTTMIRLSTYDFETPRSWDETTANGWCTTHDPRGRAGFGVDLSAAGARRLGAVDSLMIACMSKTIRWGVPYTVLGARLPSYDKWLRRNDRASSDEAAQEYLFGRRANGKSFDAEIQMYRDVPRLNLVRLIPDYFEDEPSHNYGALFRWDNPFYRLRWIPGARRLCALIPPLALRCYNLIEDRKKRKQQPIPIRQPKQSDFLEEPAAQRKNAS